jgi:hypothetical protein
MQVQVVYMWSSANCDEPCGIRIFSTLEKAIRFLKENKYPEHWEVMIEDVD